MDSTIFINIVGYSNVRKMNGSHEEGKLEVLSKESSLYKLGLAQTHSSHLPPMTMKPGKKASCFLRQEQWQIASPLWSSQGRGVCTSVEIDSGSVASHHWPLHGSQPLTSASAVNLVSVVPLLEITGLAVNGHCHLLPWHIWAVLQCFLLKK